MSREVSTNRSYMWVWATVVVACTSGVLATYFLFVEPPPPRRIVMASGSADGAYHQFAERYQELLKKEGVTLDVRTTHGSVENVQLLLDESSDIDVAFVQTGIADPEKSDSLMALASLYREPLWIFHRGSDEIDRLTQLQGQRIAIGPEGSGTRGIALQLLSANGIDSEKAELKDIGGTAAADAFENNEIDTAFFVAGVDAAYIQRLLRMPNIQLVELKDAKAYERRFRFLSTVTIHAGLLDLQHNIPSHDTTMVAPAATLVAHHSLHPALITLLLKVAAKVHRSGDLLATTGEFPSAALTDLPLSDDADRYFRVGPPVLQRILPFWLASLVDRLKIMLIPLIMLMMPLVRMAPPLVRWQTRRKIYLWYAALRKIDQLSIHGMSTDEARQSLEDLRRLEQQIAHVGVPLSYMEEYYNLRLHLNLVRARVSTAVPQAEPT
ncbi:TAXI family TRAP transporter solute-binding subunit [Schlesneria paludicola]|uniref:TAXI family TRAP transporter solute-binding subunit n=1 Tax=Schlesneria paludicola TaxID=360056 RepID=UPI00029AAC7E|nr:TAXI family TRAP transporter solute-binding subunit [Schlesneria paludicola]